MDIDCYNNGSCKMCGCKTTALQMANKACDKPCYPTMLSRKDWNRAKELGLAFDTTTHTVWLLDTNNLKFI